MLCEEPVRLLALAEGLHRTNVPQSPILQGGEQSQEQRIKGQLRDLILRAFPLFYAVMPSKKNAPILMNIPILPDAQIRNPVQRTIDMNEVSGVANFEEQAHRLVTFQSPRLHKKCAALRVCVCLEPATCYLRQFVEALHGGDRAILDCGKGEGKSAFGPFHNPCSQRVVHNPCLFSSPSP